MRVKFRRHTLEQCGPCPAFACYILVFALELRKNMEETSVRVVEKCQF